MVTLPASPKRRKGNSWRGKKRTFLKKYGNLPKSIEKLPGRMASNRNMLIKQNVANSGEVVLSIPPWV